MAGERMDSPPGGPGVRAGLVAGLRERWRRTEVPLKSAFIGAVAVVFTGAMPVVGGLMGRLGPGAEAIEPGIRMERYVIYMGVRHFRDRSVEPAPIFARKVGQPGTTLRRSRGIFDEAECFIAIDLRPHAEPALEIDTHTSGVCESHSISPPLVGDGPDIESYQKADGKILTQRIPLKDAEGRAVRHVALASRYYNGFQAKADGSGYESDVGSHIKYRMDEFVLVVDFRGIDHGALVRGTPEVSIHRDDGTVSEEPSAYKGGVLTCTLKDPPVGAHVVCDWSWATEPADAPAARPGSAADEPPPAR